MFEISATDVWNLESDGGIELHVDVFWCQAVLLFRRKVGEG